MTSAAPSVSTSDNYASRVVPVFSPIAALILGSIYLVWVARFLKKRERYKLEIIANQAEVHTLRSLSYIASIDRTLQMSLFYMATFKDDAPDAV